MKFGQRFSIRKDLGPEEISKAIWNPQMDSWRDVLEDYLYISKKRYNNKLSIFKLQLNIFQDIVANYQMIDKYKELRDNIFKTENYESSVELTNQISHIESEIFRLNTINKALREIIDGLVWKYFNYNRAILYMLADKPPIEIIRINEGTKNNIYEFTDVFLNTDSVAIYNDITNFLRVGDVTQIKDDGSIEIIEVKSGKKRGSRITRQKEKMTELVEFFNTGLTKYDGKKLKIINSNIKQKTYLNLLKDAINKAKYRGFESILIGDYLILQITDFSKVKKSNDIISYFESRHTTVKNKWKKNNDFISSSFFIDKMEYSKNCAPFSIYPFDLVTCADLIIGRLMISSQFNFSELLRIINKSGWNVIDSIIFKKNEEIKELYGHDIKNISFLKIRKGYLTIDIPPSLLARIQYELLSPFTIISEFDEIYNRGPQKDFDFSLVNYTDEQNIWN